MYFILIIKFVILICPLKCTYCLFFLITVWFLALLLSSEVNSNLLIRWVVPILLGFVKYNSCCLCLIRYRIVFVIVVSSFKILSLLLLFSLLSVIVAIVGCYRCYRCLLSLLFVIIVIVVIVVIILIVVIVIIIAFIIIVVIVTIVVFVFIIVILSSSYCYYLPINPECQDMRDLDVLL